MIVRNEAARIGDGLPAQAVLDNLPFDADGLIALIARQYDSGEVLMLAWMNRIALDETLQSGYACYCSRPRKRLWRKGESSGCRQRVLEARLDCDGDALLLLVEQHGPACHTGRHSCFYNALRGPRVEVMTEPLVDPDDLYARGGGKGLAREQR